MFYVTYVLFEIPGPSCRTLERKDNGLHES